MSSFFLNMCSSRKGLCQYLSSTLFIWEGTVVQISPKRKVEIWPWMSEWNYISCSISNHVRHDSWVSVPQSEPNITSATLKKRKLIFNCIFLWNIRLIKGIIFFILCCLRNNYYYTWLRVLNLPWFSCYLCGHTQMPRKICQAGAILLSVSYPKKSWEQA